MEVKKERRRGRKEGGRRRCRVGCASLPMTARVSRRAAPLGLLPIRSDFRFISQSMQQSAALHPPSLPSPAECEFIAVVSSWASLGGCVINGQLVFFGAHATYVRM